jgi:hypothetical protein
MTQPDLQDASRNPVGAGMMALFEMVPDSIRERILGMPKRT